MADGVSRWLDEPADVPRVAKGIPNRVSRLKCLGNAIVPQVAYRLLTGIYAECVGSGKKEATGLGTAKVVPQCWHDGITFPSGAWVDGQWKPCAP